MNVSLEPRTASLRKRWTEEQNALLVTSLVAGNSLAFCTWSAVARPWCVR